MKDIVIVTMLISNLSAGEIEISENAKKADWLYGLNRTSQFEVLKKDLAIMGAVFARNEEIDLDDLKTQCEKFEDVEERYRELHICKLIELY